MRRTWHCRDDVNLCRHCGRSLLEHEQQRFCPPEHVCLHGTDLRIYGCASCERDQLKQQLEKRDKVIAKWMAKAEELGEKAQIAEQQVAAKTEELDRVRDQSAEMRVALHSIFIHGHLDIHSCECSRLLDLALGNDNSATVKQSLTDGGAHA